MSGYSPSESDPPPTYTPSTVIPTLYDDTHRGVWALEYSIMSMGHRANLIGYLEHHDPTSDGSFAICIAGGTGACVSKVSNHRSSPLQSEDDPRFLHKL